MSLDPIHIEIKLESQPDGSQIVALAGHKAKRLIDLELHRIDLIFVQNCIDELTHKFVQPSVVSEALWTAALVKFFKCFGVNAARFQLSPKTVFKTDGPDALVSFDTLQTLRNKTMVHDENGFMEGRVGALVVPSGEIKVKDVVSLAFVGQTLDAENFSNFSLLVKCATNWVQGDLEKRRQSLITELNQETLATLLARGPLQGQFAVHGDIKSRRSD